MAAHRFLRSRCSSEPRRTLGGARFYGPAARRRLPRLHGLTGACARRRLARQQARLWPGYGCAGEGRREVGRRARLIGRAHPAGSRGLLAAGAPLPFFDALGFLASPGFVCRDLKPW